jgi:hypothetical protein
VATLVPTTFRSLSDMSSNVKALGMVPFRSSHQHGPPVLGRVRALPRSPTSSLLCSPPTPCPLQPPLWFPWRVAYLAAGACSVPWRPTTRAPAPGRASETGHRLSATPECIEERRGPPRLRGRPLRPCHGRTPRRIGSTPRPPHGEALVAFRYIRTLGLREGERFRGRLPHGPPGRLPTHRRGHF